MWVELKKLATQVISVFPKFSYRALFNEVSVDRMFVIYITMFTSPTLHEIIFWFAAGMVVWM